MKKILFLIMLAFPASLLAQTNSPQVKITNGILQGTEDSGGIRSFKGVPFAKPPVGNLRWKAPLPPLNWAGIRMADHFGPQAMQEYIYSDMQFRSAGKSEDCLYLNIWTPAKSSKSGLPVMVYFFGGGFKAGDGSEYRYDGESLAKKGIVTITITYRLGIFGFFSHPELTAESPNHASGNYGLMDQHAALVWIKKNIAAFGGDPNKVTIDGESAGSESVAAQVASPLSKGLFRGAIAESGSIEGYSEPTTLAKAEQVGLQFAKNIGVTTLADLRKISAASLLKLSNSTYFPLNIDGYFLPESPTAIMQAGKQMHVALMGGWNSAEVDYHSFLGKDSTTVDNYKKALQKNYGNHADDVFTAYPATNDAEVKQVATDLASDEFIIFSTWKFIDLQTQTGGKPVYRYLFARKRPAFANGQANDKQAGASHSSEIEFALGNLATNKVYAWSADDYKVSDTMENYFANFIKTGNPNGDGLPKWPKLQTDPAQVMVIDLNSHAEPEKFRSRYLLLDKMDVK
jgi:para-nitrobenzyl esterase